MLYLMSNLQADLKYKLIMFRLTCGRIDATKNLTSASSWYLAPSEDIGAGPALCNDLRQWAINLKKAIF